MENLVTNETYYEVRKLTPWKHEMSIDDLWFSDNPKASYFITENTANTKTYKYASLDVGPNNQVDVFKLIGILQDFNERYDYLREQPRESLYNSFKIPKKKRGFRQIDAPKAPLKLALYNLKSILENDFGMLYHTTAFAYVPKRSTVDMIKRHQQNESMWFAKFDMKDFFGSTTLDFVMHQMSMIYPTSRICQFEDGKAELRKALELGFLNGGLPQGTPLSPTITNIMMIPIDYELSNTLRRFNKQNYIYTRYADDLLISNKYNFRFRNVEGLIVDVLNEFHASFSLNREKTRYGNRNGSNWNLGLMLNKDNEITVGYKAKKRFKAAINNFAMDYKNGIMWNKSDLETLMGYINYYRMVEPKYFADLLYRMNMKYNLSIEERIMEGIRM